MRIGGVDAIHVIPLLIGHHFERQLVVIAQEHGPLAAIGNRRCLIEDVDDRKPVLHLQRHEHARHERKVEVHVRFVALAKVSDRIFRPLIGLREQHAVGKFCIDMCAQLAEIVMGLRQIFAACTFAFVKIRDGVETESVDTHGEPKIAHLLESFEDGRIVEIQVRLMRIKAMPVIGFRDRVPCPIRGFKIFEDDPRIFVFLRRVAPHIELAFG